MSITNFKELPILGILRGINEERIEPLVEAVVASGLKTIEITMNTDGADKIIKKTTKAAKGKLDIGAGTVLNLVSLKKAVNSGASFVVMPVLVKEVVAYCVKNKIAVFPGALTPQEIYTAWQVGATMVKVFPASLFGSGYFKEVKAPFSDIKLLACGGINSFNIKDYFYAGASAVAFGASIFRKDWIEAKEFYKITAAIKELINAKGKCA